MDIFGFTAEAAKFYEKVTNKATTIIFVMNEIINTFVIYMEDIVTAHVMKYSKRT
jgi:hypothetical protein